MFYRTLSMTVRVVDLSYHNASIEFFTEGEEIALEYEQVNDFDETGDAIAVFGANGRFKLGYVNREDCGQLNPLLDTASDHSAVVTGVSYDKNAVKMSGIIKITFFKPEF